MGFKKQHRPKFTTQSMMLVPADSLCVGIFSHQSLDLFKWWGSTFHSLLSHLSLPFLCSLRRNGKAAASCPYLLGKISRDHHVYSAAKRNYTLDYTSHFPCSLYTRLDIGYLTNEIFLIDFITQFFVIIERMSRIIL